MASGRQGRGGSCGLSVLRTGAALALCATALTGCADLKESFRQIEDRVQQTDLWPFSSKRDEEGLAEAPVLKPKPEETALAGELALDKELVTKVQDRLAELGYRPGPVDGVMGRKTREALKQYQDDSGLPADGKLTKTTLSRLNAPPQSEVPGPQAAKPRTGESAEDGAGTAASEAADAAAPEMAVADIPMPGYEPGTRFVYADGEVHTVVGVEEGRVQWETNGGGRFETASNFLIPRLSWHTAADSGARAPSAPPEALWPFRADGRTEFTTATSVRHTTRPDNLARTQESWSCQVDDSAEVTVRAGTFDTYKVVCDVTSDEAGADSRHVWHYAPEIGHYVLHETMDGARRLSGRDELMAIQPDTANWPPVARAGLGWALEHALETAEPGEETDWRSSAVETRVTIKPEGGRPQGKKQACRNFRQIWSGPEGDKVYPGFACREPSGHWAVPGLDSGVAVAETPS